MKHILTYDDINELELELTGTCNLSCYVCSRNFIHADKIVKRNIRSVEDVLSQAKSFKNLKYVTLAGTLSEPTLYPQFITLVQEFITSGIHCDVFTNGNTHNERWWEEFGKIANNNCRVIFTICGSTQELHSYYRVGSCLHDMLNNVKAFKKNSSTDYCQHILFEYNQHDYENGRMQYIFKQFSHSFQVTAEYQRRLNVKHRECPTGIIPPKKTKAVIDLVFNMRKPTESNIDINCRSYMNRKLYIDQFGNVFPCFTYAEFVQKPFLNTTLDYSKIYSYCYQDCWLCSQNVDSILKPLKIDITC